MTQWEDTELPEFLAFLRSIEEMVKHENESSNELSKMMENNG